MSDIDFSDLEIVFILLTVLAPGLLGGALIGAVAWHLSIGERWWIGLLPGAVAGTAVWFAWLRYG